MSQYRQSPFANITPVVKNLLIINVIFAIAEIVLRSHFDMEGLLGIYYFNSPKFHVWQIVSYMFMHAPIEKEPAHLLFNMFALFMFGPILEYSLGSKKFLNFYLICGIGAIVFQWVLQAVEVYQIAGSITIPYPTTDQGYFQYGGGQEAAQTLYDVYNGSVVGASGAIFGVLVAFAAIYPNMELLLFFIPIPIKAKYVISGYVLLEIYESISQAPGDHVAHLAHIGGAIIGFLMVKIWRIKRMDNFY
jgi:membrane associated rhomboid family serine protease